MTMSDDTPVSTLVLPVLLRPILSQVKFHIHVNYFDNGVSCCDVTILIDFAVGKTRCGGITNTSGGADESRTGTSRSVL